MGPYQEEKDHEDPGMAEMLVSSVHRRVAVGLNTGRRVVRLGDQINRDSPDAFPESEMRHGVGLQCACERLYRSA